MIAFLCPHCGRKLKVKDEGAGRTVSCPHCAGALTIPRPVAAPVPVSRAPQSLTEAPTLPPADPIPAMTPEGDTHSDADPQSGPSVTEAAGAAPRPEDWTEFLGPAEGPGELGRLGPYRVLAVLGAGGMGVVYQAEDPHLQRLVALKALLPSLVSSLAARQRFLREAQSAAAIEHDHIVPIYQVGEDRGVPFLAMQFLRGETLDERLKRAEPLSLAEVLRVGREAAAGLAAAHKQGVIHRDVKPANLWLEAETGRVKLLDFGLARPVEAKARLTQTGDIIGTPAYMAPEQAAGKQLDARCDLFSLGCVLYRLCTGQPPFQGSDTLAMLVAVAADQPKEPREINLEVPTALSDLVMQMLAKRPEERPASARAVVEAIRAIEADLVPPTVPIPRPARPQPARAPVAKPAGTAPRRHRLGLVVAACLAVLLLSGVGYLTYRLSGRPAVDPEPGPQTEPVIHLFNGKDLTNFYTYFSTPRGGNALAARNNDPNQVFSVHDGLIHISGQEYGCLCTPEDYTNYRLLVEYRWGEKTWSPREGKARNGGVLLHGVGADGAVRSHFPESLKCQMLEGGTGTLYAFAGAGLPRFSAEAEKRNNVLWYKAGAPLSTIATPGGRLDPDYRVPPPEWKDVKGFRAPGDVEKPVGEWNQLECVCVGDHLTVLLNGQVVNVASHLSHTHGKIALLSEGAEVFFRTVDLQPLDGFQKTLPEEEKLWQALFTGKDLSGWDAKNVKPGNWGVNGGVLWTHGEKREWLTTDHEYADFELRLEYRMAKETDSGVVLRTPAKENPSEAGLEIQIINDPGFKGLKPDQTSGSLVGIVPSSEPDVRAPGEWNHMHITAQGRRVTVDLNGLRTLDADLDKFRAHGEIRPGLLGKPGRIGLQSHTSKCDFREIYVRPLPP
jgi:serine/threonine protein kinase